MYIIIYLIISISIDIDISILLNELIHFSLDLLFEKLNYLKIISQKKMKFINWFELVFENLICF
jgi:hypothetical protein